MPITLSETGNLGFYWYKNKSERYYKKNAYVGACTLGVFGIPFPAEPADPPGAESCNLCFEIGEFDPEKQQRDTIIAQGPEWVEYVCAPPCDPEAPPVCICCVGPNYIHEVRSPDVESEEMFYMLWDTSDHGRWCREGTGYCPDGKIDLTITSTEIVTDADDEEIHVIGSSGNSISASAICIRYSGGTPSPYATPRLALKLGDTINGIEITKIYHYSKWNNVENNAKDLNYHYVELATPLTGMQFGQTLTTSRGANITIVAGGGVPDKCIVFGRFEFIKKKIFWSKLKTNPALYTQDIEDDGGKVVRDEYPVRQKRKKKKYKWRTKGKLRDHMRDMQGSISDAVPELKEYSGNLVDSLDQEIEVITDLTRNDDPVSNKQERYLEIYEDDGVYERNSEGNEGFVLESVIGITAADNSSLTGLILTDPGAGYTDQLEVDISSTTGSDATALVLGSAELDSIAVEVEGDGYQLYPAATITPQYSSWTAGGGADLNQMYIHEGRMYQCIKSGLFSSTTGPVHTVGTAVNGEVTLRYTGVLPTFSTNLVGTTRTEYVEITKPGSGYTSTPAVTFNNGTQTAVATMDGDRVIAITVTPGDGATSNPIIYIGDAWVGNEPYTIGDQVYLGPNLYVAAATGTSGLTAPTHTSGTASDGNLLWTWVGEAAKAVSTNYDGKITEVTITNTPGTASQVPEFTASLPTSPYITGTQLQISATAGDFTLTDAVLTNKGYGYTESTTTITTPQFAAGVTSPAIVEGVFSATDISAIQVGDDFVTEDNEGTGIVNRIEYGGTTLVCTEVLGQISPGDRLWFSAKQLYATVTDYRLISAPKALNRINTTLHEAVTTQQVVQYTDQQSRRQIPEMEDNPDSVKDSKNYTDFLGADERDGDYLDKIFNNTFSDNDGKKNTTNLIKVINEMTERTAKHNAENIIKIQDLPNTKVKKYGPVRRWRDIPLSTTELKIMPVKWVPDKREQVKRTFTITMTFTGNCDTGTSETPIPICGVPCCPPQANYPVTFSYSKYFVNNFSKAAERWSNIIKTYNEHPSNANWSFL